MKKNYIAPAVNMVQISQELPIADSATSNPEVGINRSGSVEAGSVEVKGQRYSVWDDDWSE